MSKIEEKRQQFRQYLDASGVVEALTKALTKLYETPDKPECAVKFVQKYMCEDSLSSEDSVSLKAQLDESLQIIEDLKNKLLKFENGRNDGKEISCSRSVSEAGAVLTDEEMYTQLKDGFQHLKNDETCKSLLKKYLTEELIDISKTKKTSFGSTLLDCIKSGLMNHDSKIGIYAPDAEAYSVFADIFNPIINDYHVGFDKDSNHPKSDWGDTKTLENIDPEHKYVLSTRVRCARSVKEFPFNPRLTEEQYLDLMAKVKGVLENLDGEFKGTFYSLEGMDRDIQQKLIDDHFLFKEGDRFLHEANACNFWPKGRGIFFNEAKTFLIWVNEEDHLRFISMQKDGDLGSIYQRLIDGVSKLQEHLNFSHHDRLGWMTFCPSNLGTTIRASVHIKLPKLSANFERFEQEAAKFNLQIRGTSGEHTEAIGGIFDISNKRRLGLTEYEAVKEMYDGIKEFIRLESELEGDLESN